MSPQLMSPLPRRLSRPLAVIALTVLLAACSSTPSRFYVLTPLAPPDVERDEPATARSVALGIGPVELPKYLDRPQIVTRTSGNELLLAELDQWAGRLEDNFTRVVAENLSSILETDRISLYPWTSSAPVDYQVSVVVTRFERAANGAILLDARWTIVGEADREVLLMTKSSFSESATLTLADQTSGIDYDGTVSAMSRTVADLSLDIAAAIARLQQR